MDNIIHYYTIQVIAIPVEDCESFRDCTSCSSLGDPLCGWCSIERKCSRRSECSNNNETRRWIQDQTMCIVDFAILLSVLSVQMINQKVCSVACTLFLSHTRVHTHAYTHTCIHACTCTHILCTHVHTLHKYAYTHTHAHMHIPL